MAIPRWLIGAVIGVSAVIVSPSLAAQVPATQAASPATPGAQIHQKTDGAGVERLKQELGRISATANAVVGVAFHHLETGHELSLNGSMLFPMASTLKVPVAVHILSLVEEGRLRLDQVVTLKDIDVYTPTYGPINNFFRPGSVLTLRDLLTLMLTDSDNNATDVLYRIGGGTAAVKKRMRSFGLSNIDNDRPTIVLLANLMGRADITEDNPISTADFRRLDQDSSDDPVAPRSDETRAKLRKIENADTRDTTTPADMAALLVKIWNGQVLQPASRGVLLDIMYHCITGPARLKGMLPPSTRVAHKTGTLVFATNDVGIIDLPGGAGHLVAVVYTKNSREDLPAKREAVIADLTRAAYDYFTMLEQ